MAAIHIRDLKEGELLVLNFIRHVSSHKASEGSVMQQTQPNSLPNRKKTTLRW